MKNILMVLALGAMSSSAIFAANLCTGPGVANGGQALKVYTVGAGGDVSNVTIGSATLLAQDTVGSCTVGPYTFSNFQVYGSGGFVPDPQPFFLTVQIDASGVDFLYTNLGAADIELAYQITPGITGMTLIDGTAQSITENVCTGPVNLPGLGCTSLSGGPFNVIGSSSVVTVNVSPAPNGTDFIVKDITGGSDNSQQIVPEPMTLSLMGFGLVALGFAGRRLRK